MLIECFRQSPGGRFYGKNREKLQNFWFAFADTAFLFDRLSISKFGVHCDDKKKKERKCFPLRTRLKSHKFFAKQNCTWINKVMIESFAMSSDSVSQKISTRAGGGGARGPIGGGPSKIKKEEWGRHFDNLRFGRQRHQNWKKKALFLIKKDFFNFKNFMIMRSRIGSICRRSRIRTRSSMENVIKPVYSFFENFSNFLDNA